MTFHAKRTKRKAKAKQTPNRFARSPRIAVSLDAVDLHNISWLADQKGKPVASVVRDAIWAYLLPYRTNPALKLHPSKSP